ncbi:MAG: hypothetical protein K0Q84_2460, partial [Arthrobacter sp.]|nr:hypothetical protein [Arthrobacter sp.]
ERLLSIDDGTSVEVRADPFGCGLVPKIRKCAEEKLRQFRGHAFRVGIRVPGVNA